MSEEGKWCNHPRFQGYIYFFALWYNVSVFIWKKMEFTNDYLGIVFMTLHMTISYRREMLEQLPWRTSRDRLFDHIVQLL